MPRVTEATKRARADAAVWEQRARNVKAEYDVLRTNRLRRQPTRETQGEGGIFTPSKRALGVNIGRDLERNYSPARGIIHQFRSNVVGSLGKLMIKTGGTDSDKAAAKEGAAWFNEVWAKDCEYRDGLHWSEVCQNVMASSIREGDVLGVFDDGLIEGNGGTGKLVFWEADQVLPVGDSVLTAKGFDPKAVIQDSGIIRTLQGRPLGYMVTGKRGLSVIDNAADATFWAIENAVMPRSPWRFNQGRGAGVVLTAAASFIDLYEMLAAELQTGKRQAKQYAYVNRKDAVDDWDTPGSKPEYLPENDGKDAATVAAEGANSTTAPGARNYEALEDLTGGFTDYGDPGDSVIFPPSDRPNVHMPEFIESVLCHAGAAFGLARAYSMLRADSSYTAFRGDMILSWHGAFYPAQKWLERRFADWCAIRALRWAMAQGKIPALPVGWDRRLSWRWPKMPEVKQIEAENATAQALKNGTTDYSDLLGPDWEDRLTALAAQLEKARELNIPLGVLEMKSGGEAGGQAPQDDDDDESKTNSKESQ